MENSTKKKLEKLLKLQEIDSKILDCLNKFEIFLEIFFFVINLLVFE